MVCNKGYLGLGQYKSCINGRYTKSYRTWCRMLNRCYGNSTLKNQISYIGCYVCDEWLNYQNFAKWFEENYIDGYVLDKDILIKGNKIYSSDTCCFVPQEINNLFLKRNALRGDYPIGVCYHKKIKKFVALINYNGKQKTLGCYFTPEEAFNMYKIKREAWNKEVANKYKSTITTECYNALINYIVEITD